MKREIAIEIIWAITERCKCDCGEIGFTEDELNEMIEEIQDIMVGKK